MRVYIILSNTGKLLGAMDGLSYAVKDNITVKNIPTTCGSRFLKGTYMSEKLCKPGSNYENSQF